MPHLLPTSIECCDDMDECNKYLEPVYEERSTTSHPGNIIASRLIHLFSSPVTKAQGELL